MSEQKMECTGCGSVWSEADLAEKRLERPGLISCCPERNMQPAPPRLIPIGDVELRLDMIARALGIPAATLDKLRSGEWVAVPREPSPAMVQGAKWALFRWREASGDPQMEAPPDEKQRIRWRAMVASHEQESTGSAQPQSTASPTRRDTRKSQGTQRSDGIDAREKAEAEVTIMLAAAPEPTRHD